MEPENAPKVGVMPIAEYSHVDQGICVVGLGVYRGKDYPALRGLLGEIGFSRMMREFVAAQPSRHRNLRWYGGELAKFLSRSLRWRRRPLLAELAQFEWALGLAFDAADVPAVTAEEIARFPAADWPGMRLRLDPSVRLLWLRSNAPMRRWCIARCGVKR